MMKILRQPLASLSVLACLISCGAAQAAPAAPVDYADARHYLYYLEHSQEQDAMDLREKINSGSEDLANERKAAEKDGISLDPARLQAPLPPADQNAAPVYTQLMQLLEEKPLHLPDYANSMSTRHIYTKEQIAAVQKIYDSRPDVWNLVHQAADKPQCVFARDWSLGPALTFPEFSTVRAAGRLLETESYLLAQQGHYQEAVVNQARGFRVAQQAGSDPSIISYLVGCACDAIALTGMESILSLAGPNPDICAAVRQAVSANRPRLSLRRGLVGDMVNLANNLDAGRQIAAKDALLLKKNKHAAALALSQKDLPAFPAADQRFLQLLWKAEEADFIHNSRLLIDSADQPPSARKPAFAQPLAILHDDAWNPVGFMSNVLLPVLAPTYVHVDRVHTQEDVLIAAADVLAVKSRTKDFPPAQTLTTLDSFNQKPLQYRPEGATGFVVYSSGPNGDFDGGKPGDKHLPLQAYFRYPAVPEPSASASPVSEPAPEEPPAK